MSQRANGLLNRLGAELVRGQWGGGKCEAILTFHVGGEGPAYPVQFIAGFFGIAQDANTMALTTQINWLITQNGAAESADIGALRGNLATPRHPDVDDRAHKQGQ